MNDNRPARPVRYVATVNVPGYLPMDDDPPVFDTAREAWQYLVGEVERSWDEYPEDENGASLEAHIQLHNVDQDKPGTVYGPTPGYEGEHDLGLAYSVSIAEDDPADESGELSERTDNRRREVTAFIGRTAEGDRIYADMSITTDTGDYQTTEHTRVSSTVRLSASGFRINRHRRTADSAGQMLDDLLDITTPAAGWTLGDVRSLHRLWKRWHLNDMRAGCAHMTLPDDESYDARRHITCNDPSGVQRDAKGKARVDPTSGAVQRYQYGHAWLYEAPSPDALAEWERLMTLPTGEIPTNY